MSETTRDLLPRALRRQVIRFAKEYIPHLVLEAMLREGLLDPVKAPDRVALARELLEKAAKLVGGMEKGPFQKFVVPVGDAEIVCESGPEAIIKFDFESEAEVRAFDSAIDDLDGYTGPEFFKTRPEALARVREIIGNSPDARDKRSEEEADK